MKATLLIAVAHDAMPQSDAVDASLINNSEEFRKVSIIDDI